MLEIKEVSENQFDKIWPIFKEVIKDADTYPYSSGITEDEAKKSCQ